MNEEYAIKHFDLNFAECRYIGELYRELRKNWSCRIGAEKIWMLFGML